MRKQKNSFFINLLLLLLVCFLFFITDETMPQKVASVAAMAPSYRGRGDAAALLCVIDWNAAALPEILSKLKERQITVTFAVSGQWARENPELLRKIAEDGHEIASMGDNPGFNGRLSEIVSDLEKANESIEALCARKPPLYYSGTRKLNISSRAAQKTKMRHIQCTVDLLCAKGEADDILLRASDASEKGNIILIRPTKALFDALDDMLDLFQTKGLNVTKVGDIL